jgi:uncharacterized membrane protein
MVLREGEGEEISHFCFYFLVSKLQFVICILFFYFLFSILHFRKQKRKSQKSQENKTQEKKI